MAGDINILTCVYFFIRKIDVLRYWQIIPILKKKKNEKLTKRNKYAIEILAPTPICKCNILKIEKDRGGGRKKYNLFIFLISGLVNLLASAKPNIYNKTRACKYNEKRAFQNENDRHFFLSQNEKICGVSN